MLHLICALKPEARPLLDHFDLRRAPGATRIYHNPAARISLTRSGIGKAAAATAVARTRAYFNADKSHAWLNLGIAGHVDLPLGQAVIIKKVTDARSGQTWFPSRVFPVTLPAHDLLTLDQPGGDYQREVFDMEGAGFFQAASGVATLELIQAVKIISDNAAQPLDGVNPDLASRLLRQNLPVIEALSRQLLALATQQRRLADLGPDLQAIARRWHFSASQGHQLRAALRRWRALHPEATGLAERLRGKKTAAEALRYLQEALERAPVRLG